MTVKYRALTEWLCRELYGADIKMAINIIERALADVARSARAEGYAQGIEDAAKVADDCWHGPGDHGCDHGRQIAVAIRALSPAPNTSASESANLERRNTPPEPSKAECDDDNPDALPNIRFDITEPGRVERLERVAVAARKAFERTMVSSLRALRTTDKEFNALVGALTALDAGDKEIER